jgi:ribA/ribD-fused uncharacterized protein
MAIDSFQGAYEFLSNFSEYQVTIGGMVFPTAEHAFQCAKCIEDDDFWWVLGQDSPGRAKRAAGPKGLNGRKISLRPDWDEAKIEVMRQIIKAKFEQNQEIREGLLETGSQKLIEGNTWNDRFWGRVDGDGENWLGRILMDEREQIRKETQS